MNLRKSILALSVVAGIVAAPMTVFAAHTHSWGSPQYYGYEDEMPGIYDDWDKCANGACVYCNKGYAKEIN